MRAWLPVACLLALLAAPAKSGAIGLQPVGTFDEPIHVTAPPGDPRLFVVERAGKIQVVNGGTATEFLDISGMVDTAGERGLLSIAFDQNYASNGLFYVFFNDDGDGGAAEGDIHVDEFRVSGDPNVADPNSRRRVLTLVRGTTASNHNGGQLQFGKDGFLYVSVGDAANSANAQTSANPHGKILRIDPHGAGAGDYGVPASNPFLGSPTPEIWSLGLRNPFRFSFDHLTGDIAIGDVGDGSFEEIDFAPASAGLGGGTNFGWPCREGFAPGPSTCAGTFTDPVFAYPNPPVTCAAIIGGYVYRGSQVSELAGRYLYTDLCDNEIRSIQLGTPLASGDRSEGVAAPAPPFSFGEDANCELYVAGWGSVHRIVGSGSASVAPACPGSAPASAPMTSKTSKNKCRKRKRQGKKKKNCKKYSMQFGFASTVASAR